MIQGVVNSVNTTSEDVKQWFGEDAAKMFEKLSNDSRKFTFVDVVNATWTEKPQVKKEETCRGH